MHQQIKRNAKIITFWSEKIKVGKYWQDKGKEK